MNSLKMNIVTKLFVKYRPLITFTINDLVVYDQVEYPTIMSYLGQIIDLPFENMKKKIFK